MKKALFTLLVITAGLAQVKAQDVALKVNPLSFFGGTDLVSGEFKIGDNSSLIGGVGVSGFKISGSKYSSFGGEVQYRYYFDEALHGWYAGGKVGYLAGKVKLEDFGFGTMSSSSETNYGSFNAGVKGGYQWVFGSGFTLDLNLGAAYSSFKYDDNSGAFSTLKGSGVLPNLGFGLGFAF